MTAARVKPMSKLVSAQPRVFPGSGFSTDYGQTAADHRRFKSLPLGHPFNETASHRDAVCKRDSKSRCGVIRLAPNRPASPGLLKMTAR